MDIVRRVMPQLGEVVSFQYVESEQLRRTLRGGGILVNLVPPVAYGDGLLDLGGVGGEVFIPEQAAVLRRESRHLARNVSLVEPVPRRLERRVPAIGGVLSLGLH